jgi:hypothetical protein
MNASILIVQQPAKWRLRFAIIAGKPSAMKEVFSKPMMDWFTRPAYIRPLIKNDNRKINIMEQKTKTRKPKEPRVRLPSILVPESLLVRLEALCEFRGDMTDLIEAALVAEIAKREDQIHSDRVKQEMEQTVRKAGKK